MQKEKSFGERLGQLLRAMDMSQSDFARMIAYYTGQKFQTTQVSVNMWVRETRRPSNGVILALEAFELAPSVLESLFERSKEGQKHTRKRRVG